MRDFTEDYDPELNQLTFNQNQATRSFWEVAGAIKEAKQSDDKLELMEVLRIAVERAPEAFRNVVDILGDETPDGEDAVNIAWAFQSQMQPWRQDPTG